MADLPVERVYDISSLVDAEQFAKAIISLCEIGDTIALCGEVGAGKTALSRFMIQSLLGKEVAVPSPTFTLINVYDTPFYPVWHCDLYRLSSENEVWNLGLEEGFHKAVTLIEWPQIIENSLPKHKLVVYLVCKDNSHERLAYMAGYGRWEEKIASIPTKGGGADE